MVLRTLTLLATLAALALGATASTAATRCPLVTKAEAATALGLPASKLDVLTNPGCTYAEAGDVGKRRRKEISIHVSDFRTDETRYQSLMSKRYGGMPKVSGLAGADLAVWQQHGGGALQTSLTVFAKKQVVYLSIVGLPKAQAQPRIKVLAAKAITRLPA